MPDGPSFEELAPYLSGRGRVEVDLALARWQIAQLQAALAAMQPPTSTA